MKLPLWVDDDATVYDAEWRVVADFYQPAFGPAQCQANAEHYAAMMNRQYYNNEEDGA
jgi:predicted metal-dependent hydrolase